MRVPLAIARRELGAFFKRPAAWVFLAAFLLVSTVLGLRGFFERGVSDLRDYFLGLRYAFVLLAPAAAMRLWAEERRARTLELLFSLPVSPAQAVLGKYLAGAAVLLIALALGACLPLSLAPYASFDAGQLAAGYLGAFLVAATYLALGTLGSALSSSQEVAFLSGALACLLLNLLGDPLLTERAAAYLPEPWVRAAARFAVGEHFDALTRGVLEARSLAYFGGVSALALFLTVLLVERRSRGRAEAALAAVLALAALGLWLDLSAQRALAARVDLTVERRNSLAPPTRALLARVRDTLVVRAYLSQHKLPEATRPATRRLLDLLEDLEAAGGGKVKLEVVDPVTPELQAAAEREGVERCQSEIGGDLRTLYAGVVLFYGGRPPAAIPVAIDPRRNLEVDLAQAIRGLLTPRPRVGVAGLGREQYEEALAPLRKVATVEALDLARLKAVPEGIAALIYTAPVPPREREVYVLDQYLQRGGRLLLLLEGYGQPPQDPWLRHPFELGALQRALEAWGVRTSPALVVAASRRTYTIQTERGRVQAAYPWFLIPTQGTLGPTNTAVLPFAVEVEAPKGEVLLATEPGWALPGQQRVEPTRALQLPGDERRPRALAVGVRGELLSPWAGGPGPVLLPEAEGGEDPLAIPLAKPAGPAALAVVGDTDFLRPTFAAQGQAAALLQNLVEWCLDDGDLAQVRARTAPPALSQVPESGVDRRELWAWRWNLGLAALVLAGGLSWLAARRVRRDRAASAQRARLAPRPAPRTGEAA
ncbi:MAG: Gldg family protein [Planctomycetota bacterium]